MFKKMLFISCILTNLSVFAMQQPALQPWVVATTAIKIQSLKINSSITIQDSTTVADVKNSLYDSEGIPAAQQSLHAVLIPWWSVLGVGKRLMAVALDDTQNIKQIMNQHNTDTFQLYLTLRSSTTN